MRGQCFNSATTTISEFQPSQILLKTSVLRWLCDDYFLIKSVNHIYSGPDLISVQSFFIVTIHTICLRSGSLLIQTSIDSTLSYHHQEHNLQAQVNWTGRGRVSTPGSSLYRRGGLTMTSTATSTTQCITPSSTRSSMATSWGCDLKLKC